MAERASTVPAVTLLIGSESIQVTGRAAAIIGLVAAHADRINAVPVGRLSVHFAHAQVKLEMVESLAAVRLDRWLAATGEGKGKGDDRA